MNPLKWLLTKSEPSTRESTVSDITASDPVAVEAQETAPVVAVKAGVKDFEAAFSFVEQGVAQLGIAAKDELKALAQKYL
ncbi:hypothetical protein [Pantoea trifolii]|uniref:hypothetical protein n=1 Tax=Candidatus Pantoea symbiotica TaxID=1884370 RepID=UPI002412FC83|nr:hypothetical protein [Pantoea rodasii]